jgi:hypothetical protein
MSDQTMKHLELIQAVITRLARNSFSLKGWAVTLVAAIFALAAREAEQKFILVALLPAVMFWGLDAYYLRQERLFRKLYDVVRSVPAQAESDPFSMDTTPYSDKVATWWRTCWSRTIGWFYGLITLAVFVVIIMAAA